VIAAEIAKSHGIAVYIEMPKAEIADAPIVTIAPIVLALVPNPLITFPAASAFPPASSSPSPNKVKAIPAAVAAMPKPITLLVNI
jgi:hypothetical protein